MPSDKLVRWSEEQAKALLWPLTDRWRHVQAVGERARQVSRVFDAEDDREVLIAAAYLHDVGYAPSLATLGFHPVDGARWVRDQGHGRLASLVAHHSGARFEAEERGMVAELEEFEQPDGPVLDALS